MDIEKKIEVILQTVIDDNKEPMTHIQFIKQKNKWVSEIKWLIKSSNLLLPMSDHEAYDQGFHDGANKTAIELSKSDNEYGVTGKLCGYFYADNSTSSATKCICGREEWEHPKKN
jgi:hypothetical protein